MYGRCLWGVRGMSGIRKVSGIGLDGVWRCLDGVRRVSVSPRRSQIKNVYSDPKSFGTKLSFIMVAPCKHHETTFKPLKLFRFIKNSLISDAVSDTVTS